MSFNKPVSTFAFASITLLFAGMSRPLRAGDHSPRRVNEAQLELKVRARLLSEVKRDALPIHVEAEGSTIILTGTMTKKSSLDLAEEVAKSVEGVKMVKNRLVLSENPAAQSTEGPEVSDALLETKIKSKLLAKTGVRAFKVEVEASSGVVSLSGTVHDRTLHDKVLHIARETEGVKEVHDLLHLKAAK